MVTFFSKRAPAQAATMAVVLGPLVATRPRVLLTSCMIAARSLVA